MKAADRQDKQKLSKMQEKTLGSNENFLTQMIKKYNKNINFIKRATGLKWNAANAQWSSQPKSQSSTKLRSTPKSTSLFVGGSKSYTINTPNSINRSSKQCTPFLGSAL